MALRVALNGPPVADGERVLADAGLGPGGPELVHGTIGATAVWLGRALASSRGTLERPLSHARRSAVLPDRDASTRLADAIR